MTHTLSSSGVLTVYGDSAANEIEIGGTTRVILTSYWSDGVLGGQESIVFPANAVKSVVVYGRAGNDTLRVYDNCWVPVDIYGEEGNDRLIAQAGFHKVHGGTGNDTIDLMVNFDTILAGRRQTFSLSTDYKSGNGIDTVNVKLDGDSFARRLINPLVSNIRSATYALEPIADLLKTKVPVIGKLDSSLTFGKFLAYSSSAGASISRFVSAMDTIRDLGSVAWSEKDWTIGTFKITSGKSASSAVTTVSSKGASIFSTSTYMTGLQNLGIKFPAFSTPTNFVKTLLGQSVSLVEYALPKLTGSASKSNSWYVPTGVAGVSVKVTIKGSISASAGMTVGLDTAGFWTGSLMSGFYVKNVTASLTAKLTGSGSATIGIPSVWDAVEAGAKATVSGTLSFSLKDPNKDGKIRINELSNTNWWNSLSKSGSIKYELAGYVGYEVLEFYPWPEWVYYEHDWVFHRGTLYSSSF